MRQRRMYLLVILAFLLTNNVSGWKTKHEYKFNLNGRTLVGIPNLKHQYTGVDIQGSLNVQIRSKDVIQLRFQNMVYTKVHKILPMGWWQQLPDVDSVNYERFPITNSTITIRIYEGKVKTILLDDKVEAWETNFIQAVIGQMLMQLKHGNHHHNKGKNSKHNFMTSDSLLDSFTVKEDTLTGECEVLYELSPLMKSEIDSDWITLCGKSTKYFDITKTVDYDRCKNVTESHFGLPSTLRCSSGGLKCGSFWTRSSVSRSVACGTRDEYILLNTVSSSRVFAALRLRPNDFTNEFTNSQASVGTYLNLTLLSINSNAKPFNENHKVMALGQIHYAYNSENETVFASAKQKRKHDSSQESSEERSGQLKSTNYPPILRLTAFSQVHADYEERKCLVQKLVDVIEEIKNDLDNPVNVYENGTLEKIEIAVAMCRNLNYDLLSQVVNIVTENKNDMYTSKSVLRDVISICGTNPAFRVIKKWIEDRKIKGEIAAELIASVPTYIIDPSDEFVHLFYDFVKKVETLGNDQLKVSSIIAMSHIVRMACVKLSNNQVQRFSSNFLQPKSKAHCSSDMSHKYLNYLKPRVDSDSNLKEVYLSAIGNIGVEDSLTYLLEFASKNNELPYYRSLAVISSRYMVFKDTKKSLNMLMTIYRDTRNPTSVRIAALSMLFYTKPPLHIWEKLAISTWYESNQAVHAYIWSTLNHWVTTNDQVYKNMTEYSIDVLPLAKPISLGLHLPYNYISTSESNNIHAIVLDQISWSEQYAASSFYFRRTQRLASFSKMQFEADAWISDADAFLTQFSEYLWNTSSSNSNTSNRPPRGNIAHSTSWIHKTLNIAARHLPKLKGNLAYQFSSLHERILPFDKDVFQHLEKYGRDIMNDIRTTKKLNYQKISQTEFWLGVPSELGWPIMFKFTVPWMMKLNIENIELRENGVSSNVTFLFTSQLSAKLSFFTPYDCQEYIAGSVSTSFTQLPPLEISTHWNSYSKKLQLSFHPTSPQKDKNLIFAQNTYPFTSKYDVLSLEPMSLSSDTHLINVSPTARIELFNGTELEVRYSSQAPSNRWSPNPHFILNYVSLWPGIEASSLQLSLYRISPVRLMFTLGRAETINGTTNITLDPQFSITPNVQESENTETTITNKETTETVPKEFVVYECNNSTNSHFNASTWDLLELEPLSNRPKYLLTQSLNGILSGKSYLVGLSIHINKSAGIYYQLFWSLSSSKDKRLYRALAYIVDDVEKWQAGFTTSSQYPLSPKLSLNSILNSNLSSIFNLDYKYYSRNEQDVFTIKGKSLRSEKQRNSVLNDTTTVECLRAGFNVLPECRDVAIEAGYMDQYNFTIYYNNNAEKYINSIHHLGFGKTRLADIYEDNDYNINHMQIITEFDNKLDKALIWIRSPHKESEYTVTSIDPILMKILRMNTIHGVVSILNQPSSCSLESEHIMTFDGTKYMNKLSECWHVLAKDCSGRSRFVILARVVNNIPEIKVNLDNYKVLKFFVSDDKTIIVNDQMIQIKDNEVIETYDLAGTRLMQIKKLNHNELEIDLPAHGLTVLKSNETIYIEASVRLRGRLCGLCGDFNGEVNDDLRNPSNVYVNSVNDFVRSYALIENNCEKEHKSRDN